MSEIKKIEPIKIRLRSKSNSVAVVEQEGYATGELFIGAIEVKCSSQQAFAEIVQHLCNSEVAIAAVQQAISALQMAKPPTERLSDLETLQDYHHALTGYHFISDMETASPLPVRKSAGRLTLEEAKKKFGYPGESQVDKALPAGVASPKEESCDQSNTTQIMGSTIKKDGR
jgi:hypothetical protein